MYILLNRYEPIFQIASVPVSVIGLVFGLRGSQSRFHAEAWPLYSQPFVTSWDATSTEWTTCRMQHLQSGRPPGCNIYRVDDLLDATSTEWMTSCMQHLQSGRPPACNIYRVDDLLDATSTEWTTHHSPLRTITPHATRCGYHLPPLIESNIFVANPTHKWSGYVNDPHAHH